MGWKVACWARLLDGHRAYKLLTEQLRLVGTSETSTKGGGTYPNLFDAHPPFQIDGNFGGTAGVCELLMQSGQGVIELLPALPAEWGTGSISGLKARGGYELSFAWTDGRVTSATVTSAGGGEVSVKVNGEIKKLKVKKGKVCTIL